MWTKRLGLATVAAASSPQHFYGEECNNSFVLVLLEKIVFVPMIYRFSLLSLLMNLDV